MSVDDQHYPLQVVDRLVEGMTSKPFGPLVNIKLASGCSWFERRYWQALIHRHFFTPRIWWRPKKWPTSLPKAPVMLVYTPHDTWGRSCLIYRRAWPWLVAWYRGNVWALTDEPRILWLVFVDFVAEQSVINSQFVSKIFDLTFCSIDFWLPGILQDRKAIRPIYSMTLDENDYTETDADNYNS
jgi:hypothetical protein